MKSELNHSIHKFFTDFFIFFFSFAVELGGKIWIIENLRSFAIIFLSFMGKLFEARVKLFKCKLPTPQSIEQSASTFSLTFQSIEGNIERARKCEVKIAQFTQLHQIDLFRLPTPTDSLNERRDVKEKYRKLNFVYVNHSAMSLLRFPINYAKWNFPIILGASSPELQLPLHKFCVN